MSRLKGYVYVSFWLNSLREHIIDSESIETCFKSACKCTMSLLTSQDTFDTGELMFPIIGRILIGGCCLWVLTSARNSGKDAPYDVKLDLVFRFKPFASAILHQTSLTRF